MTYICCDNIGKNKEHRIIVRSKNLKICKDCIELNRYSILNKDCFENCEEEDFCALAKNGIPAHIPLEKLSFRIIKSYNGWSETYLSRFLEYYRNNQDIIIDLYCELNSIKSSPIEEKIFKLYKKYKDATIFKLIKEKSDDLILTFLSHDINFKIFLNEEELDRQIVKKFLRLATL